MDLRSWLLILVTAAVAHVILHALDRQIDASIHRLSEATINHPGAGSRAEPDMRSVTARSAYMRNER